MCCKSMGHFTRNLFSYKYTRGKFNINSEHHHSKNIFRNQFRFCARHYVYTMKRWFCEAHPMPSRCMCKTCSYSQLRAQHRSHVPTATLWMTLRPEQTPHVYVSDTFSPTIPCRTLRVHLERGNLWNKSSAQPTNCVQVRAQHCAVMCRRHCVPSREHMYMLGQCHYSPFRAGNCTSVFEETVLWNTSFAQQHNNFLDGVHNGP